MIEFRTFPDDHPDLDLSPVFRGALLTLRNALDQGGIGLTATKAFKRDYVRWAVENFEWPGKEAEEVFRWQRVVNEADYTPLEVIHFLLLQLRLGRHYKGTFRATKAGQELIAQRGALFHEVVPFYLLGIDHAGYSRTGRRAPGNWDTWLNVMNVEIEDGLTEKQLFGVFYGEGPDRDNDGWRELEAFSSCVLRPLEWAGLVTLQECQGTDGRRCGMVFKTALWRSGLVLETDHCIRAEMRQ